MARKFDDLWELHYLKVGRTRIAKKLTYDAYVKAVKKSIDVGGDPFVMVGKQMAFIDYDKERKSKPKTKKSTPVKKVTARRSVRRATAASKLAQIKKILC